ncbi:unnamed protein product, partial [marine sediment metagenome]
HNKKPLYIKIPPPRDELYNNLNLDLILKLSPS